MISYEAVIKFSSNYKYIRHFIKKCGITYVIKVMSIRACCVPITDFHVPLFLTKLWYNRYNSMFLPRWQIFLFHC